MTEAKTIIPLIILIFTCNIGWTDTIDKTSAEKVDDKSFGDKLVAGMFISGKAGMGFAFSKDQLRQTVFHTAMTLGSNFIEINKGFLDMGFGLQVGYQQKGWGIKVNQGLPLGGSFKTDYFYWGGFFTIRLPNLVKTGPNIYLTPYLQVGGSLNYNLSARLYDEQTSLKFSIQNINEEFFVKKVVPSILGIIGSVWQSRFGAFGMELRFDMDLVSETETFFDDFTGEKLNYIPFEEMNLRKNYGNDLANHRNLTLAGKSFVIELAFVYIFSVKDVAKIKDKHNTINKQL